MSREMKNSGIEWIGQIPQDWDIRNIKHMADTAVINSYIDGDWIESPYVTDEGIRYLTSGNIGDGFYKEQGNSYISEESFAKLNCKFAYPGDLVFSRLNEPYGRSCILPDTEDCYVLAVDDVILRPFSYIDKKYVCYLTMCDGYHRAVGEEARGTAMKRISRTNLGLIKLSLPSLSEQHAIVHFLDRKCSAIDTAIEKTKKSIEKLEEYKKAVITKAVTKGLDPDAKMKDSGIEWIGEVPETWDVKRVKHVSTSISKGNGITKDDVVEDGDISCVRYGEIYSQYSLGFDKCVTKTNLSKVSSPQYFSYGDIICAGTGELIEEIGKPIVYLGSELCLAGGDIVVIKHKQNPLYLEYALESACSQGQRSIGKYKLKVVHISASDIGNIRIALPNIEEQNRIVEYLDNKIQSISNVIESKLSTIEKLEEYKKSLIYYAVTGKIDCRGEMV
jgi:type I restriction enzyme S subunit